MAMVENGTLATLPNRWPSTYTRLLLIAAELGTGARPGVNQAAGRPEKVSSSLAAAASPYQVLRVSNWSAGMLNLGMKLIFYKALPIATHPSLVPSSELYREPMFELQFTLAAVAVYSMAWICQLEVMSPNLSVPSTIMKAGGTTVEVATYEHLSVCSIAPTYNVTSLLTLAVKAVTLVVVPHKVDFCGQPTIASSILLFMP
jgi:hypothetical protein